MSFLTLVWNRFRKTFRNWCYILFSLFVSRSNCFWCRCGYFRAKFSNFVQWIFYAGISRVWPGYSCVRLFKYFLPTSFWWEFWRFFWWRCFWCFEKCRIVIGQIHDFGGGENHPRTFLQGGFWLQIQSSNMIDETQKPRHSNISISDVKMNLTIPNVKLLLPYHERFDHRK